MIAYRSRFKRYVELWFDMPEPAHGFDVVVRNCAPVASASGKSTDFFNIHLDLTQSEDELFAAFARNTRAQIRKAQEGDELEFQFFDTPDTERLQEFARFFNAFAGSKGVAPLPFERLARYRDHGCLTLSCTTRAGVPLVWHGNLSYGDRVSLLYSASHFRDLDVEAKKMVGRANRSLHWAEIRHFRHIGKKTYDLGGWYEGTTDQQRLLINRFKEEFGGTKVHEYNTVENRTLKAKLLAAVQSAWPGARAPE